MTFHSELSFTSKTAHSLSRRSCSEIMLTMRRLLMNVQAGSLDMVRAPQTTTPRPGWTTMGLTPASLTWPASPQSMSTSVWVTPSTGTFAGGHATPKGARSSSVRAKTPIMEPDGGKVSSPRLSHG